MNKVKQDVIVYMKNIYNRIILYTLSMIVWDNCQKLHAFLKAGHVTSTCQLFHQLSLA